MSGFGLLGLLAIVLIGLAATAHAGRNRILQASLPGLATRFEARLGGTVEPGRITIAPGYQVELEGTRLTRTGMTLTIEKGGVGGLAGNLLWSGERPVRLEGFVGTVRLPGGTELRLGFDGTVVRRPDQAVEVEGRMTSLGQALELSLRVEAASKADGPWIKLGAKGSRLRAPTIESPWLEADLDLQLEARGEGETLRGVGEVRLCKALLLGLGPMAGQAAALGVPPLPVDRPLEASAKLDLSAAGLKIEAIEIPADPVRITGQLRVGPAGELAGALAVGIEAAWLASARLPVALRPHGAALGVEVEVGGRAEAPTWKASLRTRLELERDGSTLELERAVVAGDAGPTWPRVERAAGVLRVPGPGGGGFVLPLTAAGVPLREGAQAAVEVCLREGFLQPGATPPPASAVLSGSFTATLAGNEVAASGCFSVDRLTVAALPALAVPSIGLIGSVSGPPAALRGAVSLATRVHLENGGVSLDLERAEVTGEAGGGLRLAEAAGVVQAPGPGGGSWLVPFAWRGGDPGAGERLVGDLQIKEAFLRPAEGGAPQLPPLRFEGRVGGRRDGSAEVAGPLATDRSRLHLLLKRSAAGGFDGSKLHGQVAPEDLGTWIPAGVRASLFEDAALSCQLEASGALPDLCLRGEVFAPRLLGGTGTLRGQVTGLDPPEADLALALAEVRIERMPTDLKGARAVAPHLEAAVAGTLAIEARRGTWRVRGPVEFDQAALHFLEPVSRAAVAQGLPAIERRLREPARARLEFEGGRLRLDGLTLAAGPLRAEGAVAFGGSPSFLAGLTVGVDGGWLRRAPWPLALAKDQRELALKIEAGQSPAWCVSLDAPARFEGDGHRLDLASLRLVEGRLELAEGRLETPAPGGRTLVLPLAFAGHEAPDPACMLDGTLGLSAGLVLDPDGSPAAIPPLSFSGELKLEARGAVRLAGQLATERSHLRVEVVRAPDGDLVGTRVSGPIALDEFEPLIPAWLRISTPAEQALNLDLELEGPPADLGLNGKLTAGALRLAGGGDFPLPRLLLGDLAVDFGLDRHAFELRALTARLVGGRIELSGSAALDEDPVRYEAELRLKGVRVEKLPTDAEGTKGLEEHLEGALSGELSLRGKGAGMAGLHGRGELTLSEPRYLFLHQAGQSAGIGPLPVQGKGRAQASLRIVREELHIEGLQAAIEQAKVTGDVLVGFSGRLRGKLEARIGSTLLARSPLLALPAAAIDSLQVAVAISGTVAHPKFDADIMGAIERLMGKSTVARTMKGAVDTLWATFGREGVQSGPELDRILARILGGGPDADASLERLIATGITPSEVQELLEDYRDRRGR